MPRKLAVIMHTDVAGYSRLAGEDEDATHHKLKQSLNLISRTVVSYHGRIINTAGDAALAMFEAAVDAVSCAVAIQRNLNTLNKGVPDERKVLFRIGINIGDVIEDDGDIFGDGVNVAARLEGLAEPGGTCIAESVYTAVGSKLPLEYLDIGSQMVKNIAIPVRAYQVHLKLGSELPLPSDQSETAQGSKSKPWQPFTVVLVVISIVAGGVTYWFKPWEPRVEPASVENMAYPLPDKPSLAILPFNNLSDESGQSIFADGITEDLTTELSKISGLFVIARNSAFVYKDTAVNVNQVAEELGVRYVLEGSIRRAGDQVRVNAQLIDATTGGHIWAERYDGDDADIFAVQDEFIRKIVKALAVNLTEEEEEEIGLGQTDNISARELFQKGWNSYLRYSPADNASAADHFKAALRLDPEYGQAYAALGLVYLRGCQLRWHEPLNMSTGEAFYAADKNRKQTEKYPSTLANVASSQISLYDEDYENATAQATRAIAKDPNDPEGYVAMAWAMITTGNPEAGLELLDRARRLNPTYPNYYSLAIGIAHYAMGDLDKAAKVFSLALELDPGATELALPLAATYAMMGKRKEAQAALMLWKPNASESELRNIPFSYHFPYSWDSLAENTRVVGGLKDGLNIAVLPLDITVDSLLLEIQQQGESVRLKAIRKIGLFGPLAVDAVPALINLLNDEVPSVRKGAIAALGRIGPEAQAAVPVLEELDDFEVKAALLKITGE